MVRGVRGHVLGSNPWLPIEDTIIASSAKLVGARNIEVAMMNSLTVNLHLGLVSLNTACVVTDVQYVLVLFRCHSISPPHSAIR